jgi:hypothetical protein
MKHRIFFLYVTLAVLLENVSNEDDEENNGCPFLNF